MRPDPPVALHITDKPPGGGGIRRAVNVQRALLQSMGWETALFRLRVRGDQTDPDHPGTRVRLSRRLSDTAPMLTDLRAAAIGARVVHLHLGFASLAPDVVRVAAETANLVVSLHDIAPFAAQTGLRAQRLKPIRAASWRAICSHASAILAPSRYLVDLATQAGAPAWRTHLAPHWVPTPDLTPPAPSACPPHIVYAGLLSASKGAPLLLEAFASLPPSTTLTFLGDGPAAARMQKTAKRAGFGDRVLFTGAVSHDDVLSHMARARVVAMPSQVGEGLGLSGIEAMRLGRPVAGSAKGGMVDWLRHDVTGIACDSHARALATALKRPLLDPELADKLGHAARQHCAARYGRSAAASALGNAYPNVRAAL